jgi:hypothetical protein
MEKPGLDQAEGMRAFGHAVIHELQAKGFQIVKKAT